MPEALARTYARFVANLDYAQLPAPVVDKLKASLLHAMFVSLVGAQTAHGKAAIELVKEEEVNSNGATVLADGARASRSGAAFANSKLMHATNQADSYRMLTHPGPCVIPAGAGFGPVGRCVRRRGTDYGHGRRLRSGVPHCRRFHRVNPGPGISLQPNLRNPGRGR